MAKGKKGMVSRTIPPRTPSVGAKARKRMGLPPIPRGKHSAHPMPGPQK